MQTKDTTPKESTDPVDTNNPGETAPFVCTQEDCFAAFGSTSARDDHEASDHSEEGA